MYMCVCVITNVNTYCFNAECSLQKSIESQNISKDGKIEIRYDIILSHASTFPDKVSIEENVVHRNAAIPNRQ